MEMVMSIENIVMGVLSGVIAIALFFIRRWMAAMEQNIADIAKDIKGMTNVIHEMQIRAGHFVEKKDYYTALDEIKARLMDAGGKLIRIETTLGRRQDT
jgi:hypothetical protein